MRVIAKRRLVDYWTLHPDTEHALKAWYDEVTHASWQTPQDIRNRYANASFLANDRVVFNIKGNRHRLVVVVLYRFGKVFIKFIGTHAEYDKIDAARIQTE